MLRFNVHHSINAQSILANLDEQIEEDFNERAKKGEDQFLNELMELDFEDDEDSENFEECPPFKELKYIPQFYHHSSLKVQGSEESKSALPAIDHQRNRKI